VLTPLFDVTQDLEILSGWELKMRNKVESSGIEEGVRKCAAMDDPEVQKMATEVSRALRETTTSCP
jgi:hypothetical protein